MVIQDFRCGSCCPGPSVYARQTSEEYQMSKTELYHRTTKDCADLIINNGFKDGCDSYGIFRNGSPRELRGVWLSDVPLDANEGAEGDTLLKVTLPLTEVELSQYEVVEDKK